MGERFKDRLVVTGDAVSLRILRKLQQRLPGLNSPGSDSAIVKVCWPGSPFAPKTPHQFHFYVNAPEGTVDACKRALNSDGHLIP
ncbi:hypothetical protein HYU94_04030 [Candidatus Daviesbacteria bacterium]|nr:hypothetical protein [Candidatus Daviesbacteria bacterium]